MFRSIRSVVLAATAPLLLSACMTEEMTAEIIETNGDNPQGGNQQVVEDLSCAAIQLALVEDLAVSENTAENLYEATTFSEWCEQNITNPDLHQFVGNADAWQADETDPQVTATSFSGRATRPSLAQGARLDLHVLEPEGTIPFVRKIHFADWEGPNGSCALEMRVYQQDVGATGKKPLLYFHGGGWKHRSTTMTAAEVITRHLVKGHVVFMPAYPLHQDKDGPIECQQADFEEILASGQQAFDWVVANKDVFGATGAARIDVMGHSAGGQLAAYIATQNIDRVGKLVNFYGPVEFANFIDESRAGGAYETDYEGSRELLASILNVNSLEQLARPYDDIVTANSLSEIIAREGAGAVPPFFMVQGNADKTVPVTQALLPCNALGGDANSVGGIFECGSGSHLAILDDAGHNLDRRCAGGAWPRDDEADIMNAMKGICPTAGGADEAVRTAVRTAFDWLAE